LEVPVDQSTTTTTPPGSPPPNLQQALGLQPTAASAPAPNPSSIMEVLANLARQNTSAPAANLSTQPKDSSYNVSNAQSNSAQQVAAMNQTIPFPPIPPPVNVPAAAATFAAQNEGSSNGAQNFASNQTYPFAAVPPLVPPTALDPAVQQQLMLIKALSDQGIPPDKIASLIAAMGSQGPPMMGAGGIPPQPQVAAQNQNQNVQNGQNGQNGWGTRPDEPRDHNGFHESLRSPNRYRRRSRSPSPTRAWNARDSPASRRRDEPNYDYDRDSPGRNRGDDRGRGRGRTNDYRQRSPPRRGRSPTPPPRPNGGGSKWIGHDPHLPKGNIKGLRIIPHLQPRPPYFLTIEQS
jgi:protein NRD1